jgi:hypothetical protein
LTADAANLRGIVNSRILWRSRALGSKRYVKLADWWKLGALISVVNIIIWLGIGGLWWRILGLW